MWFPLVGEWLDHHEAEIFFAGPGDAFTALQTVAGPRPGCPQPA